MYVRLAKSTAPLAIRMRLIHSQLVPHIYDNHINITTRFNEEFERREYQQTELLRAFTDLSYRTMLLPYEHEYLLKQFLVFWPNTEEPVETQSEGSTFIT